MGRKKPGRVFVTCDVVLLVPGNEELQVLLVRRRNPPFEGRWAIPGGFIEPDEPLDETARRELREETGVEPAFLEQLYTFGDPRRDPRGRVITVTYLGLAPEGHLKPRAGTDAAEVGWFPASRPPPLAFDHRKVLRVALSRLRAKTAYSTIGFHLMPRRFTLSELQRVHEMVLQEPLDKRNFRKKFLSLNLVRPYGRRKARGAHRPAQLYAPRSREVRIIEGLVRA